jgi:hypothetical protein
MSRKAFLGQVSALLLAVVGVSAMLKSLGSTGTQAGTQRLRSSHESRGEYGDSTAYGG